VIISLVSQDRADSCFWAKDSGVEGLYRGGRSLLPGHSPHVCPPSLAKNVAADIAVQLCESVANKLEGKVMGTFSSKYLPRPRSAWVEVMKSPPFLLDA